MSNTNKASKVASKKLQELRAAANAAALAHGKALQVEEEALASYRKAHQVALDYETYLQKQVAEKTRRLSKAEAQAYAVFTTEGE